MGGGANDAVPTIPGKPQAGDLQEEVGGSAAMGWRPDFQNRAQNAGKPQAGGRSCRKYQVSRFKVLPTERGALLHRTVLALGDSSHYSPVLVVLAPRKRETTSSRSVRNGRCSRRFCERSAEGDREVEEPEEDPGPPGR